MRIALMVEYDGSQYHGWQAQAGLRTVEQVLENAISKVADETVSLVCAGRTDTGVHATGQIIHFDTQKERSIRGWIHGTNSNLPKNVAVKWGQVVSDEFHARYKALSRRYQYIICNTSIRPALLQSQVTWQYRHLDYKLMHEAGQYLLGENDFTSFRSVECQSKSPKRNIHSISVTSKGDFIIINVTANAFLHHMVRNIAGVLMTIGSGRRPVSWIESVLKAKDRKMGAETAPPYGLYLVNVKYPQEFGIPSFDTKILFGL